jgi:DNA-binding MarR family transcriptional regulator
MPSPDNPDRFRAELERRKKDSVGQLLFRCARLFNEMALARVRDRMSGGEKGPHVRASHTSLFPFIDLEGTRLTELAARMGVSKQAAGQLVEELEQMGVLERAPDPADGRAKLVRFSARGRRGLLEGLALLRRLEGELSARMEPGDMERLHGILLRLLGALESSAAPPSARRTSRTGESRPDREHGERRRR